MKNINITEPCSENWNEMTPTQKGAFCQKCTLEVVDFTNKSGNEIRTILAQNMGSRVCGHIGNAQLVELNSDFEAWKMKNSRSYQRAWVFTLFVVFGLTLFSCEEEHVVEKMHKVGQQILAEQIADKITELNEEVKATPEAINEDAVEEKPVEHVTAETKVILKQVDKKLLEQEEIEIINNEPLQEERPIWLDENHLIDGMFMSTVDYDRYLLETIDVVPDTPAELTVMSGLMYPNPASHESTLKLQMPQKGKAEIGLYNLNGVLLREIHNGRVSKGETEFRMDVSDLEAGTYLVVIVSDDRKETVTFTKI